MDEQVVRPKSAAFKKLLSQFVVVRIVDMNEIDIQKIQFDYDLVFAVVFMNANDDIYSRYGNRTPWNAESRYALEGLTYTMRQVIELHDHGKRPQKTSDTPLLARDLFSTKRSCIHCHQVWEGLRSKARNDKTFDPSSLFVYPPPENIGLKLDVKAGNNVVSTKPNSICEDAGIQAGDIISAINGYSVFSQADVTWALHNAPPTGAIKIEFSRDGHLLDTQLQLEPGWKETKLSWRASMRNEQEPQRRKKKSK